MKQSTVQRLAMRRRVLKLLGAGSAAAAGGWPALQATAQARNATLVIGLDISDAGAVTPDPARMNFYTPPLTTRTVYETLITLAPGDYQTLRPLLAVILIEQLFHMSAHGTVDLIEPGKGAALIFLVPVHLRSSDPPNRSRPKT